MYLYIYLQTRVKKDFAKRLGISIGALANYASGVRLPPLDVALKIKSVTRNLVKPEDLLKYWRLKNDGK